MILFPTNGKENIYTSHNCFCKIEAIVHDQIIYRFSSSSFFPSLLYTCYVERTFLVAEPAPVVLIWVCHEHCCYFSTTDPSVYMNRECIHVSAVCYYWFWISCCSSTSATDPLDHVGLHVCSVLLCRKIYGKNMDKRPYSPSSTCMQILNICKKNYARTKKKMIVFFWGGKKKRW